VNDILTPFWTRPLCALDTETTGVDSFNDRIVTCSMIYDDGRGNQTERDWLINPGVEIPTGASDVHGITNEVAQRDGMEPQKGIYEIATSLYQMVSAGVPLVVYNAPFDLTLLIAEFRRWGIGWDPVFNKVIDPLVIDKAVDKYRKGSRKLIDTAKHYGYDLTNAHAADADNKAAIHIARHIFPAHFTPDTTLEEVHQLQIGWKAAQARSFQAYLRKEKDPEAVINQEWPVMTTQENR
jgi:DNA polymerase-3 subunit epsilon